MTEDADNRVLLLEAGPEDSSRNIHYPALYYKLTGGPLTWGYQTVPSPQRDGLQMPFAQARVLGGGSSINGMVFTRGHRSDFVQHIPYQADQAHTCRLLNLSLRFADGALGSVLINSEGGYGHEVEIEVSTERGQLNTDATLAPVVRFGSSQSKAVYPSWRERFEPAYLEELKAWVEAASNGSATGPGAWDGYRSLVIAKACIESAYSGLAEQVAHSERPELYGG